MGRGIGMAKLETKVDDLPRDMSVPGVVHREPLEIRWSGMFGTHHRELQSCGVCTAFWRHLRGAWQIQSCTSSSSWEEFRRRERAEVGARAVWGRAESRTSSFLCMGSYSLGFATGSHHLNYHHVDGFSVLITSMNLSSQLQFPLSAAYWINLVGQIVDLSDLAHQKSSSLLFRKSSLSGELEVILRLHLLTIRSGSFLYYLFLTSLQIHQVLWSLSASISSPFCLASIPSSRLSSPTVPLTPTNS